MPHLLLVARGKASKAKVADLDAIILGQKQVLALEVSMQTIASVEICDCSCDVYGETDALRPGEFIGRIADTGSKIAIG